MLRTECLSRGGEQALDQSKTEAMKNFEANLDALELLIRRLIPNEVLGTLKSLHRTIKRSQKRPPMRMTIIERDVSKITGDIRNYVALKNVLFDWMSVMLVTFLEGYLEDGLMFLAMKNPNLMKDAAQIDPKRVLEVGNLEELRNEIRQQWAQAFLKPGGPETWLKRLDKIGARGYDDQASLEMQYLWDTRNLIVHSRGAASVAFARKYSSRGVKAGERVRVSMSQFQNWLRVIKKFTIATDEFFSKYGETTCGD